MRRALILALAALILASGPARATCTDELVLSPRLITDLCWDCLFPITIAGQAIVPGDAGAPPGRVGAPVCFCRDLYGVPMVGLTIGLWQPVRLIELVRTPGCTPALGGAVLPTGNPLHRGSHESRDQDLDDLLFYHYHVWSFPVLELLGLFAQDRCNQDGYVDVDALYLSELDPTWSVPGLALYANPEAALFANAPAVMACSADAIAATAGTPIDAMFWCAGSWGPLYPLQGTVLGGSNLPRQLSLLATRAVAAQHRRGLARRTMGSDTLCEGVIDPFITKSMYRMSMWAPLPEAEDNHAIGESPYRWGAWRTIPGTGEDAVYVLWRWTDCCTAPR